ncbi:MAG: butyryl-CoA dehydrogenase, partial [Chloroflexota bacterium]
MDFSLTPEQELIQETVRSFVEERILPKAIENDIAHRLDLSVIEGMAELGLLGIVIPEEYGGAGLDFVSEALVCEEIERGEAAFRTLISVHLGLNSLSLLRYGTEEQKRRFLVPQARGEKIGCFGLTEPAAGSDVAAMKTTARREGDVYVLNGQKNWISYATVADHALVFAKTDPQARHRGITAFVVEKGMKGFTSAETEHKLGVWAGSTGELFFENVEVPVENRIGEEWQG